MSLRRASAWSTGGTLVARIGGALGGLVVAVILGPAGRGTYALWTVGATIAGSMALGGLQFWVIRQSAQDGHSVRALVRRHLTVSSAGLAAVAAVIVVALGGAERTEALAAIALVGATLASSLALGVPNGRMDMGRLAAGLSAGSLSYLALVGLAVLADRRSVAIMLAAAALAELCMIVPCWSSIRALPGEAGEARYRPTLRAHVPAAVGETALYSAQRVDVFLVAAFLPLADVGRYSVATALAEVLMVLPDGISQVLLPSSARTEPGGPDRVSLDVLARWTVAITAAGGVVLALVARPVLGTLLGAGYREGAVALPWMIPGVAALAVWKLIGARLAGAGDLRARTVGAVAALVLIVSCDLAFIPAWGIRGAAAASSLGYVAAAVIVLRRWQRLPVVAPAAAPVGPAAVSVVPEAAP